MLEKADGWQDLSLKRREHQKTFNKPAKLPAK
jgi:hypothetical protein